MGRDAVLNALAARLPVIEARFGAVEVATPGKLKPGMRQYVERDLIRVA